MPELAQSDYNNLKKNDFLYRISYHQKVPPVAPDLELKATYGLAAPEDYQLPPASPQWTPDVYKAFDITKMPAQVTVG